MNLTHFIGLFSSFSVVVKFNINHTVDASEPENFPIGESSEEKPDAKLESKPQFEVDIVRNDTTLSFTCSILSTEASEGEYGKTLAPRKSIRIHLNFE